MNYCAAVFSTVELVTGAARERAPSPVMQSRRDARNRWSNASKTVNENLVPPAWNSNIIGLPLAKYADGLYHTSHAVDY